MAQESETLFLPCRRCGSAREAKLSRGRRVIHSRFERAPGPEHCACRGRSAIQMPPPESNPVGHPSTPAELPISEPILTPLHLLRLVTTSQDPPASQATPRPPDQKSSQRGSRGVDFKNQARHRATKAVTSTATGKRRRTSHAHHATIGWRTRSTYTSAGEGRGAAVRSGMEAEDSAGDDDRGDGATTTVP